MLATRLTAAINSAVDIPFLTELQEDAIIQPLMTHIVAFLPAEVVTAIDTVDGFVSQELLNQTLGKLIGLIKVYLVKNVPILKYNPLLEHLSKGIAKEVLSFAQVGKTPPTV